jgi:membrane protein required for colicin V production
MDPQHGLNVLDYSVLGIIVLSGLLALMRGFVREIFSLAAWAGAYFTAAKYYPLAEPWTHRYIKNQTGATALAAIIVFVVALTIFAIAGHLLAKLIRGRALTAIDRSLGFLFGLLRGMLIVCLLYLGASYIPWLNMDKLDAPVETNSVEQGKEAEKTRERDKPPEWLVEAKTRPALAAGANMLKVFIPEKEIEKTMQQYDDQKTEGHRMIEEQAHDMLEAPAASPAKPEGASGYDDKSRSNLDSLIIQKYKQ